MFSCFFFFNWVCCMDLIGANFFNGQQLLVWRFTHWTFSPTVVKFASTAGIQLVRRSLVVLEMDTSKCCLEVYLKECVFNALPYFFGGFWKKLILVGYCYVNIIKLCDLQYDLSMTAGATVVLSIEFDYLFAWISSLLVILSIVFWILIASFG